jgi:hypothetical protein
MNGSPNHRIPKPGAAVEDAAPDRMSKARMRLGWIVGAAIALAAPCVTIGAQRTPGILPDVKAGGSANVRVLAHVPLGGFFKVGDLTLEQSNTRPFAYVAQSLDQTGFTAIDLRDPERPGVLYRWRIERAAQHRGMGGTKARYFSTRGRTFLVLGVQFAPGSLDDDLLAIVFDVTGLPDASAIREVARIREPARRGGVRDIFTYKHSDARPMLFAAVHGPEALVYDLDAIVAGRGAAVIGRVPIPELAASAPADAGYAGLFVGYDPSSSQDRMYGAGRGGYFVYDVSDPARAKLLTSVVGAAGVMNGSSITPTPDGRHALTTTDYEYSPLRVFDLEPGLEGKVQTVSRPVGAWVADWHDAVHAAEMRWPLAFVASLEDGLQVINVVNPADPRTVGWYYTCLCEHQTGFDSPDHPKGTSVINGAIGVDVRNSDGLVAVTDASTGLWVFRMEGFGGWRGEDWSMPDVTRAQDWGRGPIRPASPIF